MEANGWRREKGGERKREKRTNGKRKKEWEGKERKCLVYSFHAVRPIIILLQTKI